VTNTSDHEIVYDTALSQLDIQVRDAHGNMAPLTQDGLSLHKQLGMPGSSYNHLRIQRGDTVPAGDFTLGGLYDLRPGHYTLQVLLFDKETNTCVKSNKLTITVTQ
jgi:hypothetical protein